MGRVGFSLLGLTLALAAACGGSESNDSGNGGAAGNGANGGAAGNAGTAGQGGSGGSGTGGTSTGGNMQGESIPLAELPGRYAEVTCGAMERCAGAGLMTIFLSGADCLSQLTRRAEDGDFNRIETAVQNGTVIYDPLAAPDCLAAVEMAACDELRGLAPDACEQALAGTVELGGNCEIDQECIGADTFCRIETACPGTCSTRLTAGAACVLDSQCATGLVCFAGECVVPPSMGDPCGGGVAPDCSLGTMCTGEDAATSQPGTCVAPSAVFSESAGAPCVPDGGVLCEFGSYCAITGVADGGITSVCEAASSSGGVCNLALPDMCPVGQYCDLTFEDLQGGVFEGTCVALPGEGLPCLPLLGKACEPGAVCVEGVCRTLRRLDETCVGNAACYSGNCASGVCAVPDPCSG